MTTHPAYHYWAKLTETVQSKDAFYGEKLDALLEAGLYLLDMPVGIISQIKRRSYTVLNIASKEPINIQPLQVFPLRDTYCSLTVKKADLVSVEHAAYSEFNRHPCYDLFALESYIGVPLWVGGEIAGTLNFTQAAPRQQGFSYIDRNYIRLMGHLAGSILAQQQMRTNLHTMRYRQANRVTIDMPL